MKVRDLLANSTLMFTASIIFALILNLSGYFPGDVFTAKVRANLTVLVLAVMMTISLSRIPYSNLNPIVHRKSVLRATFLGIIVAASVPVAGYLLMRETSWAEYSVGLVFVAAAPFAASVVPLSYILRGDMEHAARGTIIVYIVSLAWIPFIIYALLGESVDMRDVVITVVEIIGVPLILSRLLTKVKIERTTMSIMMNVFISFLVILAVGATIFPSQATPLILFAIIAAVRTLGLGFGVEFTEKGMGIPWSQRVTDVLMVSYRNKGIAIAMCVAVLKGPAIGYAMVAIATSIVIEICWVVLMDSYLFSRRRMVRELEREGSEVAET